MKVSVKEISDMLDVTCNTVKTWINNDFIISTDYNKYTRNDKIFVDLDSLRMFINRRRKYKYSKLFEHWLVLNNIPFHTIFRFNREFICEPSFDNRYFIIDNHDDSMGVSKRPIDYSMLVLKAHLELGHIPLHAMNIQDDNGNINIQIKHFNMMLD